MLVGFGDMLYVSGPDTKYFTVVAVVEPGVIYEKVSIEHQERRSENHYKI